MAEEKNPLVEMIRRIRMDIFERMQRGKLNYERDMSTLRKHADIAETINQPILVGQLHDMMGIVEEHTGHFDSAAFHFSKAFGIFQEQNDVLRMGRVQNNLGELYRFSARYEFAMLAYTNAREYMRQAEDDLALVESNMGLTRLAMSEFDRAENHFLNVISLTAAEPWNHIPTLIEARRGLAEVCLAHQNFEEAWRQANEAYRLASERNQTLLLAEVNLTRAHIAEVDSTSAEPASTYYEWSREGLREQNSPSALARALLDEARYQQRRQHFEETIRLASEAYGIFRSLGLEEEAKLAQTLREAVEQL